MATTAQPVWESFIPRVVQRSDSKAFAADAGDPLPAGFQLDIALPYELPFRRFYAAAYVRDDTLCDAVGLFQFWHHGELLDAYEIAINNGAVTTLAAGASGRLINSGPRPPFIITDAASGSGYVDTVATAADARRFVWRVNGRDISAVCLPVNMTLAADRLTVEWAKTRTVTTASVVTAVLAAAVVSSNYPNS